MKKKILTVLLGAILCINGISAIAAETADTERIFVQENFVRNPQTGELTEENVADILGAGWSILRTTSDDVTADGTLSLTQSYSAFDGGAVAIVSSADTVKSNTQLGLTKSLDTPAEGEVTVVVSTARNVADVMGIYQGAFVVDGDGQKLAQIWMDNNHLFKITVGGNTYTIATMKKSLSYYYDIQFVVDTENNLLDFALCLNFSGDYGTAGDGMTAEQGTKLVNGAVTDCVILRPEAPYSLDTSAGVSAVSMYSSNSGNSVRKASFDNLLIHNIPAPKVTGITSDRGEQLAGADVVSSLVKGMVISFSSEIDAKNASVSMTTADGTEIPCTMQTARDALTVSFDALEMRTDYTLAVSGIYDSFGSSISFSVPIRTGYLPVLVESASVKEKTETGVTYTVKIKNEYTEEKAAVILLVQYGSDNKMKQLQITDAVLSPLGVTETEAALEYKEPKSGDRVELLVWNSMDVETGVHPLLSLEQGYGFTIQ